MGREPGVRAGDSWLGVVNNAVFVCSVAEHTGLLLLTYISSRDNHMLHVLGFVCFAVRACSRQAYPQQQPDAISFNHFLLPTCM